jgi:tetratricopeptide (TPR) repeat protein
MIGKSGPASVVGALPGASGVTCPSGPARRSRSIRSKATLVVALVIFPPAVAVASYFAIAKYREAHRIESIRELFAARHYDQAREPLRRWLAARSSLGEAHYYEAWLAVADDRSREAFEAIERATKLSFDSKLLRCLTAILHSRAGQSNEAELVLRQALDDGSEPRAEVAQELARIYLRTFRLERAASVIERWNRLAPEKPEPYLWSNEIASRSDGDAAALILNYRQALARDPKLDKARLGLAEQLTRDRRYAEAEQEFRTYLEHYPHDVSALVGLGRIAFQRGDHDQASKHFEAALAVDPRQPEALKELAQTDMRRRRFSQACRRLELLVQLDPYDPEIRYSYAQALKLQGDDDRARPEFELATRLRQEQDRLVDLRHKLLKTPSDLESRFEVARWMLQHGHDKEGLDWTKEILRTEPTHAPTHRLLVDYHQKHGEPGLANYHRTMTAISQEGTKRGAKTP